MLKHVCKNAFFNICTKRCETSLQQLCTLVPAVLLRETLLEVWKIKINQASLMNSHLKNSLHYSVTSATRKAANVTGLA